MNKNIPKTPQKFNCINCGIETGNKKDYSKHLLTAKHLNRTNTGFLEQPINKFKCKICNKIYKARNSLWYHEQKCKSNKEEENVIVSSDADTELELKTLSVLVVNLIKSNQDLQKQMLDVCQKIQPNTTTITNSNNNSHNKNFNLNFFLNEQCKDAMNIMDFVNTFQLQLSDLERIGEVGYVEGISNIVIDKLNQMDIYKRPIHCSDAKREIMHVKDKDVWEKDTPTNAKIRLALKHITKKNTDLLRPWVNAHPGVLDSEHRLNDKYQKLFNEAMGGNSGTLTECETKIIKKISKMVLIDKSNGNKSN